jgi:hypothetical protein
LNIGPRRENVPDPHVIADQVISDIRDSLGHEGQGQLDAIGTLTDLNENDLIAVVIRLAEIVVMNA